VPTPRILCLHGGGTNAEVLRLQCREIVRRLSPPDAAPGQPRFRLVFADAPFYSHPHVQIMLAYGALAPFRRWLRWQADQEVVDGDAMARDVLARLRDAMADDDAELGREGKTGGEWVAVLGFSQGAKIAASLVWAQERVEREAVRALPNGKMDGGDDDVDDAKIHREVPLAPADLPLGVRFRFAVLMAGRAPVVRLAPNIGPVAGVAEMNTLSTDFVSFPPPDAPPDAPHRIRHTPTLHVHGLQDPGLDEHRRLLREYCASGSGARCVEWDGEHRLPIRTADVDVVVGAILEMAAEVGVKF
jgi:predicted esterase